MLPAKINRHEANKTKSDVFFMIFPTDINPQNAIKINYIHVSLQNAICF